MTFDSYDERTPRFSPDGRKLFFIRSDAIGGAQGATNPSVQIYSVGLEKLDRDPDDPEERAEAESAQPGAGEGGEGPVKAWALSVVRWVRVHRMKPRWIGPA